MPNMRTASDAFFRYLPEERSSLAFGLSVTACGWTRIAPGAAYPPAGHPSSHHFAWDAGRIIPELQIIVISRGEGEIEMPRGRRQRVASGAAILLPPGAWHRYRPVPAIGWDEHWLAARGRMVEAWQRGGCWADVPSVLQPASAVVRRLLSRLRTVTDLAARHPPGFAVAAAGEAVGLVAELLAVHHAAADDPGDAALRAACCRLAGRPDRPLSVPALAAELGIPERTLRRRFLAVTGCSPKRWHDELRLAHAERLVANGLGVGEAASACGYRSRSACSRRLSARGRRGG
jgi:AraC-like DNA-binding protein